MGPRKIIFLINPISGTGDNKLLGDIIEKNLSEAKIEYKILPTDKNGDYKDLHEKIISDGITDVVICGGDGSVNQVLSFIYKLDVNVGIIPLGSGNGLAFAAGIPANPVKALKVIIDGNTGYTDAFRINESFGCMLCGIGFDAQVAHDFALQKKRGLFTYIRLSIDNFLKCSPYPFDITINGKTISTESYFISLANSNQFGNNVTIAPRASLSDGLLDIVIVNKMWKIRLAFAILRQILLGKVLSFEGETPGDSILYFQAAELIIRNKGKGPLHIDGEPKETSDILKINIIPAAFRLLQPVI